MRKSPLHRWRRSFPRPDTRFRHSDRLAADYLPESSHVPRGLR